MNDRRKNDEMKNVFKEYPSKKAIEALLSYEPETGIFRWLPRANKKWTGRWAGTAAGSLDTRGHIQIKINGAMFAAHRLAWILVYGLNPASELDHRDGQKDNNRIANLRKATHSQNQQNRSHTKVNSAGIKGVSFNRSFGKYIAQIQINKKKTYLGSFETAEQAGAAYALAAERLHGEFSRT